MLRINFTKYGFKRVEDEDFKDYDGYLLKVYKNKNYPKLRITKLILDDEVSLNAKIEDKNFAYEEYSKIEGYRALHRLYLINRAKITNECISKWIEDIEAYYNNYMTALKTAVWPTDEEFIKKIEENNSIYKAELSKAEELIHYVLDNIQNYSDEELKQIFMSYKRLKTDNHYIIPVDVKLRELKNSRVAAIRYVNDTDNDSPLFAFIKEIVNAR